MSGNWLIWLVNITGGHIPRDAPIPVVLTNTLAERIITGVASLIGILSSILFFVFNLYYNKHP